MNVILYGTEMFIRLLERFIKADIKIKGEENIPNNPVLFVVNHFTRSETILLPYFIKKITNQMPNSLAEPSLFKGKLGDYLRELGAMSVNTPSRNDIIIGDLITGRKNWIIFPEGAMIKTKKIVLARNLGVYHPGRKGLMPTGSAFLSILTELYKRNILYAWRRGDEECVCEYLKRFSMKNVDELSRAQTVIVPTNFTYFPIRPGKNIVQLFTSKLLKDMSERMEEELEVEGNLLFSDASIHLTFGTPINIADFLYSHYCKKNRLLSSLLLYRKRFECGKDPAILNLTGVSRRLTNHFMKRIYSMVTVNMDHLFSIGLLSLNKAKISSHLFKCRLFLACEEIIKDGSFSVHPSIDHIPIELLADETENNYNNIEQLAITEKIIEKKDDIYIFDKKRLKQNHEFHRIRIENPIQVIANEIKSSEDLYRIIKREFRCSKKKIRSKIIAHLSRFDQEIFNEDYNQYYDEALSKPKQIGAPFYLNPGISNLGILLCHGYMSAPEEVRLLGDYLAKFGYSVYGPRLKGHGTSPYNLTDVTWKDWYDSFNRGYAILRNACEHVIIGGFSTGGTLALLAAANKGNKIAGLFTVNAPLQLKSIKTKLVGPIHFWNELLESLNIEDGKKEYVDNEPENPEINYTKNSIKGVRELGQLMDRCKDLLQYITVPTLVIQEKNDPVVDPRSASIILDSICSKEAEFYSFELNRHGILRKEGSEEVFIKIRGFIKRLIR
ncbi:MAG: alpha/beta hydrolase [Thermodesulfobacteriota bacterium]|nr:alpha/beta hydrolase [Thermodesulfobacteriota bacterium]